MTTVMCLYFTLTASAATVSKVTHKSPQYGGGSATVFYVNANNKKTAKLNYSCTKAEFETGDELNFSENINGYFEIKIWGRNKTSDTWKEISKTNIKNKAYSTINLKGYTQYKIRVYSWKTSTISQTRCGKKYSEARWYKTLRPTCTFSKSSVNSNIKSITK